MKQKQILPFLLTVFFLLTACMLSNAKVTNCECGSHSDGITAYSVNGDDCCQSDATAVAFEHEYYEQYPGVWVLSGSTQTTGQEAQDDCCPKG